MVDAARQILDELMGRNRNLHPNEAPKVRKSKTNLIQLTHEPFDNSIKYFLIKNFPICFNLSVYIGSLFIYQKAY